MPRGRKLLPIHAKQIEQLVAEGHTSTEIAKLLGVCRTSICRRFPGEYLRGKAQLQAQYPQPPTTPVKRGRPKLPIDGEQVRKLARLGCTMEEIGQFFNTDHSTISRNFSTEYSTARSEWKVSLRRAQTLRAVKDRSDNMLIHLGKAYLGQTDRLDVTSGGNTLVPYEVGDDGRDPGLPSPPDIAQLPHPASENGEEPGLPLPTETANLLEDSGRSGGLRGERG